MLPRPVLRDLLRAGSRLVVIGLLAIGVSGLIAWAMGSAFGEGFVAGDPPGLTYSSARCADFLEYEPAAPNCEAAAARHHFGEVVAYRGAAGLLGLAALAVWWLAFRRRERPAAALPEGFEATVGATVFGVAAAALLGIGVDLLVLGVSSGPGQYLSGGVVSLGVGAWFALSVYRVLLRRGN